MLIIHNFRQHVMSEGTSFYVKQETELLIYYLLIIIKILIDLFRTLIE